MATRRSNPPPPQTQARSSTTFRPAPLDGSLALPEIWEWHAKNSGDHPFFVFARDDGSLHTINWAEAVRAIHAGSKIIKNRIQTASAQDDADVIGILASSDAIPYGISALAVIRANYVVFPISVRNSPAAVAHLINQANVKHLLIGREQTVIDLSRDAIDILRSQYPSASEPGLSPLLTFEELFLPQSSAEVEPIPYVYRGPDSPTIILHSSGSTAFPKPIVWTNHRVLQILSAPWYYKHDLTGLAFAVHPLPMYHAMGFMMLLWAASCGTVAAVFAPREPPPIPTPDLAFSQAQATNSDIIFSVPSFLETWSRNPDYVKWLATRTAVVYGGGPLNREAGDTLFAEGVFLCNGYGTTETGALGVLFPEKRIPDWEYFEFPEFLNIKLLPSGEGAFEIVLLSNEHQRPSVVNTQIDGIDGYATSDLIVPHPTVPGLWKIMGRTDDQIMHSSGEKTNPGPLESMLKQDPHVQGCVMFGRGRFQAGIIVEPKPEFAIDPADEASLAEYRNKIWPTVEKMNAYAPQHSRLFKEMILVAKPSKPFSYTAKGTVRRGAVIKDYEEEINALYDAVDSSAQSNIPPPAQWDSHSAVEFVRAVVGKVLTVAVKDDDDLFQNGCDSLQATWIRNTLLRALRESAKVDTRKVDSNFVYDHPSICQLASYILSLARGTADSSDQFKARIDAMHSMVAKYSTDFPVHQAGSTETSRGGDVILLTGTSGSFGCYLMKELVSKENVSRVYAFNRASKNGMPLRERQKSALLDRGLGAELLDSEKVVLLEGDLTLPYFGLPVETYQEVHRSVTHIIHNAWRVDFNLALTSFESNVHGIRALVDFSLTSPLFEPPRLLFTSSIGVFQNAQNDEDLLEKPLEASSAVGTGYAESKWVSEHILYNAASKTSLKPLVVRVGQLCGGQDGSWNAHEWFPSMVQSAPTLECFPDDNRGVAWIPLELAASALADFRFAPTDINTVHLVHPRPVSWHSLAVPIAEEFSAALVPYTEWLAKLESVGQSVLQAEQGAQAKAQQTLRSLRALQLLPMFKGMGTKLTVGKLALGMFDIAVAQAVKASPTLANPNLRQLGVTDVKNWLTFWRKVGLFTA